MDSVQPNKFVFEMNLPSVDRCTGMLLENAEGKLAPWRPSPRKPKCKIENLLFPWRDSHMYSEAEYEDEYGEPMIAKIEDVMNEEWKHKVNWGIQQIAKRKPIMHLRAWAYYDPFLRYLYDIGPANAARLRTLQFWGRIYNISTHWCQDKCDHDDDILESLRIYVVAINRLCGNVDTLMLYIMSTNPIADEAGLQLRLTWKQKLQTFLENDLRKLNTKIENLEVICQDNDPAEDEYDSDDAESAREEHCYEKETEEEWYYGDEEYFKDRPRHYIKQQSIGFALPTIRWFKERAEAERRAEQEAAKKRAESAEARKKRASKNRSARKV